MAHRASSTTKCRECMMIEAGEDTEGEKESPFYTCEDGLRSSPYTKVARQISEVIRSTLKKEKRKGKRYVGLRSITMFGICLRGQYDVRAISFRIKKKMIFNT